MSECPDLDPPDFDDWPALLALLCRAFAYMDGRIDPPSSLTRMTAVSLREKAHRENLFLIRRNSRPVACLFGMKKDAYFHIGKLAVDPEAQGKGLARALIHAAAQQAARLGCRGLELQTRVELDENHRRFHAMGFRLEGSSRHPGYDRQTSLIFRRPL